MNQHLIIRKETLLMKHWSKDSSDKQTPINWPQDIGKSNY